MEMILTQKVSGLGRLGEKVIVKPGYARNFLIPRKMALFANKENLEKFNKMKAELEKKELKLNQDNLLKADKIKEMQLVIAARTSEDGKLYGSVSSKEIARLIANKGVDINHKAINLAEHKIRTIGEFKVNFKLSSEVEFVHDITVLSE